METGNRLFLYLARSKRFRARLSYTEIRHSQLSYNIPYLVSVTAGTTVKAQVTGTKKYGKVEYSALGREIEKDFSHSEKDTGTFSNFIERLWAYYTINGLLDRAVLTDTKVHIATINLC